MKAEKQQDGSIEQIIGGPKLSNPPTADELEPYLIYAAEIVDRYGAIMQPWLDRMEKEYAAAKARGGNVDRIKRMLAAS